MYFCNVSGVVRILASIIFWLAFTLVALPPGKQCIIAGWFFLSLVLRVMESLRTRVFNLSALMVGGFGGSDPVTCGGETREGSASDSDTLLNGENRLKVCRLNEWHLLSIPTAFPSRSHENIVMWNLTAVMTHNSPIHTMDHLAIWSRLLGPFLGITKIMNLAFTTIVHRNALNNTFINGKKRVKK
jgi:hypothetical protein